MPVAENEQALLSIVVLAVGVGIRQRLDQTFTQHLYGGGRSERDGRDYVARAGSAAAAKATRAALNQSLAVWLNVVVRGSNEPE